jgi:hypothetical protein
MSSMRFVKSFITTYFNTDGYGACDTTLECPSTCLYPSKLSILQHDVESIVPRTEGWAGAGGERRRERDDTHTYTHVRGSLSNPGIANRHISHPILSLSPSLPLSDLTRECLEVRDGGAVLFDSKVSKLPFADRLVANVKRALQTFEGVLAWRSNSCVVVPASQFRVKGSCAVYACAMNRPRNADQLRHAQDAPHRITMHRFCVCV